ncbi:MAG: hypothetical protein ACWA5R_04160, partial [bacterium]
MKAYVKPIILGIILGLYGSLSVEPAKAFWGWGTDPWGSAGGSGNMSMTFSTNGMGNGWFDPWGNNSYGVNPYGVNP